MEKFRNVLLASDLDGTLLNSEHQIDRENRDAIRYFVENGGTFTVATGRPTNVAKPYFDELAINAPVILYNGGAIYDLKTERMLYLKKLGDGFFGAAKDVMRRFPEVGVEFHTLDEIYLASYSEASKNHFEIIHKEFVLTPIDEIRSPVIKGLFTQSPDYLVDVAQYFEEKFRGQYSMTSSFPFFLEITDKNVHKGNALTELSKLLHVDKSRICVVGDSFNDVEMFGAAGMSCAPENASEEIKKQASFVVADNDHFALAGAVEILDRKYS